MSSAHIYIVPATDKPTRNPNKMDEMLAPEGKLVINSRQIHRAKNSGAILLVPYHATEGRPLFDSENPIHQIAAAAYELSDIENTIARAKLDVEHKKQAVIAADKASEESEIKLVEAEQALQESMNVLNELEELHGSDDEDELEKNITDIKVKINNVIKDKDIQGVAIDALEDKTIEELTVMLKEVEDYVPDTGNETSSDDTDQDIIELVKLAIDELEEGNKDHWTADNKPDVNAINNILNEGAKEGTDKIKISAAQRDVIWSELNKNNDSEK